MASERDIIGNSTALRHYAIAAVASACVHDPQPDREAAKAIAEQTLRLVEFFLIDVNRIAVALEALAREHGS